MRSFIIACSVLGTIILTVIFNSVYVTHKTSELISICDSIDYKNSAESAELLLTEWRSCKDMIALTIHGSEIRLIDDALLSLQIHKAGTPEYRYQLDIIRTTLQHICECGKFTFFTIF